MHKNINNLTLIKDEIKTKFGQLENLNIIAISKTFPKQEIEPLIDYGHIHFGENKVQEAIEKWTNIKKNFKNLKLHMVGRLQTNKVKNVVPLFDYIHSLDNIKLNLQIVEGSTGPKGLPGVLGKAGRSGKQGPVGPRGPTGYWGNIV